MFDPTGDTQLKMLLIVLMVTSTVSFTLLVTWDGFAKQRGWSKSRRKTIKKVFVASLVLVMIVASILATPDTNVTPIDPRTPGLSKP